MKTGFHLGDFLERFGKLNRQMALIQSYIIYDGDFLFLNVIAILHRQTSTICGWI